jgi:hypothetical protein
VDGLITANQNGLKRRAIAGAEARLILNGIIGPAEAVPLLQSA